METEQTEHGALENWTPQEVAQAMADHRIVLIDVRTPQEYVHDRIPGALLFPMQDFDAGHLPDGGKTLVFHCGSGKRSEMVARKVLAATGGPVAHMGGGMAGWKDSGQRYITTDPATGAPKHTGGEAG
jgi:rhodanese-related sulfurtransferase